MNGLEQDRRLLQQLVDYAGVAPAVLAREAGIAVTTVNRPYSGKATTRLSQPTLDKLRARYPDFPGWTGYLVGKANNSIEKYATAPALDPNAIDINLVQVRELDLAFGMGATFIDAPVVEKFQLFPRTWLRTFTHSPAENLFFAHAIGDSMVPTMLSGDIVLIDRGQNVIDAADLIWAFALEGMGMIKRLGPGRDGQVEIISDNPTVRSRLALPQDLHVIGRVVGIFRKV